MTTRNLRRARAVAAATQKAMAQGAELLLSLQKQLDLIQKKQRDLIKTAAEWDGTGMIGMHAEDGLDEGIGAVVEHLETLEAEVEAFREFHRPLMELETAREEVFKAMNALRKGAKR